MSENEEVSYNMNTAQVRKPKYHSKVYDKLDDLERKLRSWTECMEKITPELTKISEELDKYFNLVRKANSGGSKAAIAGAVLAFIGIGLSPFSFGASLIPVGGCLAAGGITAKGLKIMYDVTRNERIKKAEDMLKKYKTIRDHLITNCIQIGNLFDGFWEIEECFPQWVDFWEKIFIGPSSIYNASDWSKVVSSAENYKFTIDVAHICEENCDHSLVAENLRHKVREIRNECPTDTEIETMIKATMRKLHERLN